MNWHKNQKKFSLWNLNPKTDMKILFSHVLRHTQRWIILLYLKKGRFLQISKCMILKSLILKNIIPKMFKYNENVGIQKFLHWF